jgi:hypothetical protein
MVVVVAAGQRKGNKMTTQRTNKVDYGCAETAGGIYVELTSAVGPRVIVLDKDLDADEVEAMLPVGWTVGDNWHLGVSVAGGQSYPLVRS